ncbi:hypothetical protein DERF_005375 [Dermatophagoides farinae]|uniref:BHLH domain-containing protein n=2 Tax=Dermatophagoides farinae TaxID=6954 RepID=A0A922I5Q2_DERFA|nr:protein dimmed-like [Dermatophagoides farinae]KAH9521743.1 hypothetical protein DERF_005375 [Dermatophagoides farinae]
MDDDYNNQNWILPSSIESNLPVVVVGQRSMYDSWMPISSQQPLYTSEISNSTTNTASNGNSSSDDDNGGSQYSSTSLNYQQKNCLYGYFDFDNYNQFYNLTTTMTMMDNQNQSQRQSLTNHTSSTSTRNRDLANDQERKRMHRLNDALFRLKEIIPEEFRQKERMSKVQILHSAIDYIRCLQNVLYKNDKK